MPRRAASESRRRLAQDLRFGARSLRKNPALTLSIVASLTLSIGATTALFSVVHGVLLRPLPYPQPDRLIVFGGLDRQGRLQTAFGPDFSAWRSQCDVCEEVAASAGTSPSSISGGSEPDRVIVARVTDNLFAAMGVQPMLGRTFLPEETGRPVFNSGTQSTPITLTIPFD